MLVASNMRHHLLGSEDQPWGYRVNDDVSAWRVTQHTAWGRRGGRGEVWCVGSVDVGQEVWRGEIAEGWVDGGTRHTHVSTTASKILDQSRVTSSPIRFGYAVTSRARVSCCRWNSSLM